MHIHALSLCKRNVCRKGDFLKAWSIFVDLFHTNLPRDHSTYLVLIQCLCTKRSQICIALDILDVMHEDGLPLNREVTFCVADACARFSERRLAERLLKATGAVAFLNQLDPNHPFWNLA
mmetsp:Transcript_3557/g.5412  ORF Transcript_3557/g.5412 Transcript_3557/m.5412 type:complete len:120 (-) Transcript_3557:87-446(-)